MEKAIQPVFNSPKDVSEDVTRTIMKTSIENNKALLNIIDKFLEILHNRGLLVTYLLSPLSGIIDHEHNSHLIPVKDPGSNGINDLLRNKPKPGSLYNILLTFRDTDKKFKMEGDLLKEINIGNYNFDLAKLPGKKIKFHFSKEMYFNEKTLGNKSTRDKSLMTLPKSPPIILFGILTVFLPESLDELCDRLNLLLQEKQAGNISYMINEEIVAVAEKLFEYRCIATKQHKLCCLSV